MAFSAGCAIISLKRTMFSPKFTINNKILQNIGIIEGCKEIINDAPLVPAWEAQFQKEAQIRTIHYGTHIEGNELSFTQAKKVVEGEEVVARERDIQEIINYRNVLQLIDRLGKKEARKLRKGERINYRQKTLKGIHSRTVEKILLEERVGKYRETQVVIRNGFTGEVAFRPPLAIEVPFQMEDFFKWLNSTTGKEIHPVLRAGIAHYELARIHPFVDGNGRVARAFAILILFAEGYDIRRLFSIEEHFDKDAAAYYYALQSVEHLKGDLTGWLEYFTQALAIELTRIKDKVKQLSLDKKFRDRLGRQIALSERQITIVEYLKNNEKLHMKEARKVLPMVSEDTILRDLKDLMKKGIVKKKGKTKAAHYCLAQ